MFNGVLWVLRTGAPWADPPNLVLTTIIVALPKGRLTGAPTSH